MNYIKRFSVAISVLLSLVLALFAFTACSDSSVAPDTVIREYDVTDRDGDADRLRVGVLGDTQLPASEKELGAPDGARYYENLVQTLTALKAQGCEVIMNTGDIMNGDETAENRGYGYDLYNRAMREVFPDKREEPICMYVMGNHDYWFDGDHGSKRPKQQLFADKFGVAPFTHYKINGRHFINWSPDRNISHKDSSGYSKKYAELLEREIEKAEADSVNGEPIFVMTHHNPRNTMVGSDEWGDFNLANALDGHTQVVSLSGHSHYSILDERSIWQGSYTAFSTQSVAYVDSDGGMYDAYNNKNVAVPELADYRPMALIMDIMRDGTEIKRINVYEKDANGKYGREEKADSRWKVVSPVEKENFTYLPSEIEKARRAPIFPSDAEIAVVNDVPVYNYYDATPMASIRGIAFPAADNYGNGNKDGVYSYKVVVTDIRGTERSYEYFADLYLGESMRRQVVKLGIDRTLPSGRYQVKVYARDCFGKYSAPITSDIDW